MPIPINLQIPTIHKFYPDLLYNNEINNITIYGEKFTTNSRVYIYSGIDFLSGTQYTPTFVNSTTLTLSTTVGLSGGAYNIVVYNTDSKLQSNVLSLEVNATFSSKAPTLASINNSVIYYGQMYGGLFSASHGGVEYGYFMTGNGSASFASIFATGFSGTNITPDTVLLLRSTVNNQRYYPLVGSYQTYAKLPGGSPITNYANYVNNNQDNLVLNPEPGNPQGFHNSGRGYIFRNQIPLGNYQLVAVNKYGISNPLTFNVELGVGSSLTQNHPNASNLNDSQLESSSFSYVENTCQQAKQLISISGSLIPMELLGRHLFNNFNGSNARVRQYRADPTITVVGSNNTINCIPIDCGQSCVQLNCFSDDVYPLGGSTKNFMTNTSTIFNTQCPVEVLGLQGTSTAGPTPVWDAWKLFASSDAVPPIPICENQGELQKQFTVEFPIQLIADKFDLNAQVVTGGSNAMNITVERWNSTSNVYEVVLNNQSTGNWTIGTNVNKVVTIPLHAATFRYRITLAVLIDSSLNPVHLLKSANVGTVIPLNEIFPFGLAASNFSSSTLVSNLGHVVIVTGRYKDNSTGGNFANGGGSENMFRNGMPEISTLTGQGETIYETTITFPRRINPTALDIDARIPLGASNVNLNVVIEAFNFATNTYTTILTQNTGNWVVSNNSQKTLTIPAHTPTYRYRITLDQVGSVISPSFLALQGMKLY
jgi:hypothetical protein